MSGESHNREQSKKKRQSSSNGPETVQPLPEDIKYLEPVLRKMREIPVDELNEDTDASAINKALLGRIKALGKCGVSKRLAADRDVLRTWLEESKAEEPAAWWIVGYLMIPGALVRRLLAPPEAPPSGPKIVFEAPAGWTVKHYPVSISFRNGKLVASIQAIDADILKHLRSQYEAMDKLPARPRNLPRPKYKVKCERSVVRFGECRGDKRTSVMIGPGWKRIDYLLEVPGGAVTIMLDGGGKGFDESAFEEKLHTLRVIQPE
jgi:hypothetical protein